MTSADLKTAREARELPNLEMGEWIALALACIPWTLVILEVLAH